MYETDCIRRINAAVIGSKQAGKDTEGVEPSLKEDTEDGVEPPAPTDETTED